MPDNSFGWKHWAPAWHELKRTKKASADFNCRQISRPLHHQIHSCRLRMPAWKSQRSIAVAWKNDWPGGEKGYLLAGVR
jgi:hypothetical protein